jgi:endonuclease G
MQPQRNIFNAGLWEKMETQLRSWASSCDTLYVCKGGTIDRADQIMSYIGSGANRIPVPKYFFMAVLGRTANTYKAMAFWVEHKNEDHSNDNLGNYVVNIYELQKLTGIDFFCNLPDNIENQVESLPVTNVKRDWGPF